MKINVFIGLTTLATGLALSGASFAGAPEPRFKIGDPAPAIEAMTWIKGEPVTSFKPGHVYVVEFWATWCGPCNAAMPHLSELQQKHAGKLTVIGVNVRESDNAEPSVEAVSAFVKKKGDKMAYTVAMDDPAKNTVFNAWMIAGGSYGIPTSFVVDGAGKLVWMGHPMGPSAAAFDVAIEQAIAGNNDLEAARALQAQVNEQTYQRLQGQKTMEPIKAAQKRKDYAAVIAEADKLAVKEPKQAGYMFSIKLDALLKMDEKKGLEFAQSKAQDAEFRKQIGLTDDAIYWGSVSGAIARQEGLSKDAYRLALDSLQKVAADKKDFFTWATQASLNDRLGNLPGAIEAQEKAIALASANERMPKEYIDELRETLNQYKSRNGKS